ncbi:MAG TPA: hypothetical protein VJS66_05395 [Burkholderiales bacterium]|nr:hypothetical protein [Burkholderiales bacterium]
METDAAELLRAIKLTRDLVSKQRILLLGAVHVLDAAIISKLHGIESGSEEFTSYVRQGTAT